MPFKVYNINKEFNSSLESRRLSSVLSLTQASLGSLKSLTPVSLNSLMSLTPVIHALVSQVSAVSGTLVRQDSPLSVRDITEARLTGVSDISKSRVETHRCQRTSEKLRDKCDMLGIVMELNKNHRGGSFLSKYECTAHFIWENCQHRALFSFNW